MKKIRKCIVREVHRKGAEFIGNTQNTFTHMQTHSLSGLTSIFSRWTWASQYTVWILLEKDEVMVTTGL